MLAWPESNASQGTTARGMDEQLWILASMAGTIAVLALVALVLFTPPRPSVPDEGPILMSVRPFNDLDPDPNQIYLGDGIARDLVSSLHRYERIEAAVGDGAARFVMTGSVKKTGSRIAVQMQVASDGRRYWRTGFDVKAEDLAKAQSKAVDALTRRMKLAMR